MKTKGWRLFASALAVLLAVKPAAGAGLIIVEDPPEMQGGERLTPRPGPHAYRFAPLRVDSVKVDARITNQIAVTTIDEEFYNPNPTRLEGTFVFPVPRG